MISWGLLYIEGGYYFRPISFIGSLVYIVTLTPACKRDFLTLCNSLLGLYGFSFLELLSTHDSPMCALAAEPRIPRIFTQLVAQSEKRVDATGEQPT